LKIEAVPNPTVGKSSPVLGMARVMIGAAVCATAGSTAEAAAAAAGSSAT
jgi:hypothetical protein